MQQNDELNYFLKQGQSSLRSFRKRMDEEPNEIKDSFIARMECKSSLVNNRLQTRFLEDLL